jgi:O-acetylserine/cysteine efflux transporter
MNEQSKSQDKEVKGFIFAILDMITYGLLPVFSNYFVKTIDPLLFGGLTTLIGSTPLLLKLKLKGQEKDLFSFRFTKPLLGIAILATVGSFFFFVGTKYTSGINTGLLIQLEPFYAIVLSAIFLGEVIKKNQIMATLTMVLGAVVLVYKGIDRLNIGDIFIVFAPMFFQASHMIAKKIMDKVSDTDVIPAARLLYSGFLLTALAFIVRPSSFQQLFSLQNVISIIIFAFIFRALDFYLWYQAIKRISVSRAAAVIPLAAAISFIGSIFFLKEIPNAKQYLGLSLIMGGLIWFSIIHLKENKKDSN